MRAFGKCYANAKGDKRQVEQFLQKHLAKLDENLLEALPQVFPKLLAGGQFGDTQNVASLFIAFGSSLWKFPLGDRALNLELSIAASQVALKVYPRNAFPEQWAGIQNNIGNVYIDRICSDRAENLEQAIAAYELALQVYSHVAFPQEWATTQNNLGIAYRNRIRGNRAENLEQAIVAYELSLQVRTRSAFPEEWAMTQNNLGAAYSDRIRGDRAENLEQAIATYELALQIYTRDAFPEKWAGTQSNLGSVYWDRIRGDRAENLEQSIAAYELALQIYTRDAFPENWGRSQNNLGNIYRDRIRGNPVENLEKAVEAYELANHVSTREAFPEAWARHRGNLAEALIKRASLTENLIDLDTAITLLKRALEVAVPGSPDFVDSQYRLGNALSRRFEHNQDASDLQDALNAYTRALDVINQEHYDRAKIWQALPATQSVLGSRLVRKGQWQEGLQLLLNSVRLLSEGDDHLAHANALYQTGRAHETLSDWDNARLYYRDALRLYEHLNDPPGIAKSRHGLGSVLASQGYFKKGMAQLQQARDLYQQLDRQNRVKEVDNLYQAAQRAEQQLSEVPA
ncbi:tetratricopeptide repeat-containing protein [Nodosilinea sp. P-1105]|nr:tetratricopeptide repeat-containing protein [Nodosilinea sp. P-1105]